MIDMAKPMTVILVSLVLMLIAPIRFPGQVRESFDIATFTLFPNAWYYKPISSNNPVIELPR